MRIFVKYNRDGQVLSVSKVEKFPEQANPYLLVDEGESVLEVPATSPFVDLDVAELHDRHMVDVQNKKLMKKP